MVAEFVAAIKKVIDKKLEGVHTAFPAKIISYDAESGLATVLPDMKFVKPDGTLLDYPQITGVPVMFPQSCGQNASIVFPINRGDGCLVIIAEQSIDYWLYGQQTDTNLKFDLTNAICIPGLFSSANKTAKEACEQGALIIKAGESKISIKDGGINIKSSSVTIDGDLTVNGTLNHE